MLLLSCLVNIYIYITAHHGGLRSLAALPWGERGLSCAPRCAAQPGGCSENPAESHEARKKPSYFIASRFWDNRRILPPAKGTKEKASSDKPSQANGCGSKLNRRGKPQVLVHVSTYQGNPFWNSGILSHSRMSNYPLADYPPLGEFGQLATGY